MRLPLLLAPLLLALCLPAPARARSLCGAGAEALAAIEGTWQARERISLENGTTSLLRTPPPVRVVVEGGALDTPFLARVAGGPVALRRADPPPYDVDAVDDMLATTGGEAVADILSDTPCGPDGLPQFVARVEAGPGTGSEGTVTLVAYFDDRLLQIARMTLRSEETVLFMVATALLTRAD